MRNPESSFRHPEIWGSLLLALMCLSMLTPPATFAQDTAVDVFDALQVMRLEEPFAAPTFSLPAVDGSIHTLEAYKGKLIFLNFWTTW